MDHSEKRRDPRVPLILRIDYPSAPEIVRDVVRDVTENLSADGGFINAANGWTKPQLYDHNPWDLTKDFGTAGNVAGDFLDPAFVASPCN